MTTASARNSPNPGDVDAVVAPSIDAVNGIRKRLYARFMEQNGYDAPFVAARRCPSCGADMQRECPFCSEYDTAEVEL